MKKFLISLMILATMLVSFSVPSYADKKIYNNGEISQVLENYYPQLYEYCAEGVLVVKSLQEVNFDDGTFGYKIKYVFVKREFTDAEKLEVLKETYPELYRLQSDGAIRITSMYKYVDKSTGKINVKVNYRPVFHNRTRRFPAGPGMRKLR